MTTTIPAGKPSISPFRFPPSLTEGMSVITTCSVLTGDPPIHVEWLKDSQPLDLASLNVHRNEMGDLGSSLVFRSVDQSHAGNYICVARNKVGEDTFTAPMIVRGKVSRKLTALDQGHPVRRSMDRKSGWLPLLHLTALILM